MAEKKKVGRPKKTAVGDSKSSTVKAMRVTPRKVENGVLLRYQLVIDKWFANGFDSAEAYISQFPNVAPKSAISSFARMQKVEAVQDYIKFKHEEARKYINVDTIGILQELKRWIEADITETICLAPEQLKELPPEFRRLINRYRVTTTKNYNKEGELVSTTEQITLSMVSKEKAMDMINRHIGFYELDNKQKSDGIQIFAANDDHANLIATILNDE